MKFKNLKNMSLGKFFNKWAKNGPIFKIEICSCIKIKIWWGQFYKEMSTFVFFQKVEENQNTNGKNWTFVIELWSSKLKIVSICIQILAFT